MEKIDKQHHNEELTHKILYVQTAKWEQSTLHGLNKRFDFKFSELKQFQQTPDKGRRVQQLKCYDHSDQDEDTS